ncbi:GDP dissociation inhibitor [Peziza echinospora]|nr:GDP dissociation inhibitor [Peziza echinospora]
MDDSGLKEEYDVIVVGTGLTECILSGIFSVEGKAVLHIDRNWYYGGESASLDLDHFWKTYRWTPEQKAKDAEYQAACAKIDNEEEAKIRAYKKANNNSLDGYNAVDRWTLYPPSPGPRVPAAWIKPGATVNELPRECNKWHIPLVPKFLMADGELTKFIRSIPALHDIEFLQVGGSFVVRNDAPHKVPSTRMEALSSPLVSKMQKLYLQNFLQFIAGYVEEDPTTHRKGLSLDKNTMREFYKSFGLDSWTSEFIGHAMALYVDDSYLDKPAREPIQRVILYVRSMARFGKSPYIFPRYGLNELPERFSRVSAVHGGLHALNTPLQEVVTEGGKLTGVKILHPETKAEVTIKTKTLIADPTYFLGDSSKIRKVGQVVRAICIINHQIEGLSGVDSAQIIIPASQMNRKNDVYIFMVSSTNFKVCHEGFSIVSVSTIIEGGSDHPERELEPGFIRIGLGSGYLGRDEEKFIQVADLYEPVSDGKTDNVYISRSYDATTHFETATDDVKDIFKRITGTDLVVENLKVQQPVQDDD